MTNTERLIEEADRLAHELATSRFTDRRYYSTQFAALAAALKACEERARKADELAAANLAVNKRIVELEHDRAAALAELAQPYICPNCTAKLRRLDRMDSTGYAAYELDKARKDAAGQSKRAQTLERERDEWMRRAQGWESEATIATERFNRLATAQPGEPLDLDCGDSSCAFAKTRGGMRTNGGCRCLENLGFCRGQTDSLRRMAAEIVSLRKRLSDLTTPRPIAEAPRDGTRILAYMPSTETWMVLVWLVRKECWACPDFPHVGYYDPAEYLPLPEVKP